MKAIKNILWFVTIILSAIVIAAALCYHVEKIRAFFKSLGESCNMKGCCEVDEYEDFADV